MELVSRSIGGPKLVRDYLAGAEAALRFFPGSPFEADSYRRKARALDRQAPRRSLAAAMIRPAGSAGALRLQRVTEEAGYFVTTGQQPGLFGGPLYSLYKALSAVQLAEDLQQLLGKPVMPLFWVASEDHDWDEANRATFLDSANELHRIGLPPELGESRHSLAEIRLGPAIRDALDQLASRFPANDFKARAEELLREAYHERATLASGFCQLMGKLLEPAPIGLVDAADAAVKEASRELLLAEADDPEASEAVLAESGHALRASGYRLQVPLIPGATNLFVHGRAGRERLYRSRRSRQGLARAGVFRGSRSEREFGRAQLAALMRKTPGAVSPNVLLRPVVESCLFPTLAYVGGPGEIAYFGQLQGLFERHGAGMPVVVPRASLLVVERKVAKVMERFGLNADDLRNADHLLGSLARDEMPTGVRTAIERWRSSAETAASEVMAGVADVDPTLQRAVVSARNAGFGALAVLEKKVVRAIKRKNETAWSQISKARANLWPDGKPQERVLGPMQYLMRYGPDFVTRVQEAVAEVPNRALDLARTTAGASEVVTEVAKA